ncbi:protein of unknown function [Methylocella tundrae]|uniref:Uncharacterized protein n=1 Tax=Methylocella tundrae TaxID=227605 RepID=A0A4U8YWT5_METTU|nr:protein of unknown function [Methylocella tundrae]
MGGKVPFFNVLSTKALTGMGSSVKMDLMRFGLARLSSRRLNSGMISSSAQAYGQECAFLRSSPGNH